MDDEATQRSTQVQSQPFMQGPDADVLCVLTITNKSIPGKFVLKRKGPGRCEWTFGRTANCDFLLGNSSRLSKCHFVIWTNDDTQGTLLIKDTSTNGTYLNNVRLVKHKSFMIVQGDELSVGNGIPEDEIRFVIQIPQSTRTMTTKGIHAMYDIGPTVGQGAFAVVRKAIERNSGKMYAIKIIGKNKITSGVAVQREIEILKQLNHDNVVGLRDFYEDANSYYLVMDYVGGGDLMDFVMNNGPIGEDASREIVRQVLLGVDYVHGLGISHRDLKPDNILIAQDDPVVVKVSDFGLAKISQSGSFLKTFCGTLAYLAPEVMSGRGGGGGAGQGGQGANRAGKGPGNEIAAKVVHYSNLVDVWSIGCLAYVILTGYLPFDGSTQEDLYRNVKSGRFVLEPLTDQNISESGIKFIQSLLQVDPLKRPSAKEALNLPWIKESESQRTAASEPSNVPHSEVSNLPVCDLRITSSTRKSLEAESDSDVSNADKDRNVFSVPSVNSNENDGDDHQDSRRDKSHNDKDRDLPASQMVFSGVRDLEDNDKDATAAAADINENEFVSDIWLNLATIADSIPFRDIYVTKSRIAFGRAQNPSVDLDIRINDNRISKVHCEIRLVGKSIWLYDLSSNGCFVNEQIIGKGKKVLLQDGDIIYLFLDFINGHKEKLGFEVALTNVGNFEKRSTEKCNPVPFSAEELKEEPQVDSSAVIVESSYQPRLITRKRTFYGDNESENGGSQDERPRKLVSMYKSAA